MHQTTMHHIAEYHKLNMNCQISGSDNGQHEDFCDTGYVQHILAHQ